MRSVTLTMFVALLGSGVLAHQATTPVCESRADREAERIAGVVKRGEEFIQTTPAGWIVRLAPNSKGWFLRVTTVGRETEDLARLTPPWHFVPNPRDIEGWHFRNADNTGPNDGSVNAPQDVREFIFSPRVGRGIQGTGATAGPTTKEVEEVRSFGRGWLWIESYTLTPPRQGERAAFESLQFSACVTWPATLNRDVVRLFRKR